MQNSEAEYLNLEMMTPGGSGTTLWEKENIYVIERTKCPQLFKAKCFIGKYAVNT